MPGTSYRDYLTEDPRPKYPPTLPAIDLTVDVYPAALEDAEGHALVDAIHRPDNPRLIRHNRKHIDGSADTIVSSALALGVTPDGTNDSQVP
jgi:hypothetical protein